MTHATQNQPAKALAAIDLRIARALRRDLAAARMQPDDRAKVLRFCGNMLLEPGIVRAESSERARKPANERFEPGVPAGGSIALSPNIPWVSFIVSVLSLLALISIVQAQEPAASERPNSAVPATVVRAADNSGQAVVLSSAEIGALFGTDLPRALEAAAAHHAKQVGDYACTLTLQEHLGGRLWPEQEIEVLIRQRPFSVVMHWVRNTDQIQRVIYVEGRWRNQDASRSDEIEQAILQPAGIFSLLTKRVFRPIHGEAARAKARQSLDQLSFDRGLRELAACARRPDTVVFVGSSSALGRPTWLLERRRSCWSDSRRRMVERGTFHIDQEHLVPIASKLYDDGGQAQVVGRYEFTRIRMQVGLTERDFEPRTYGM